jgi:hypothetical protein
MSTPDVKVSSISISRSRKVVSMIGAYMAMTIEWELGQEAPVLSGAPEPQQTALVRPGWVCHPDVRV